MAPHLVQIIGTASILRDPPTNPHPTFLQYLQRTAPSHVWAIQNMQGLENIPHIIQAIRIGNCALISDGSFCPSSSRAASAWYFGNEALHRLLSGQSPSTGCPQIQSAYRGELSGLYGGLLVLKHLCDYHQVTNGRIVVGCDGLGVLNKIQTSNVSAQHGIRQQVIGMKVNIAHTI